MSKTQNPTKENVRIATQEVGATVVEEARDAKQEVNRREPGLLNNIGKACMGAVRNLGNMVGKVSEANVVTKDTGTPGKKHSTSRKHK